MEPHGMALLAFFNGNADAELIVRRDDGHEAPIPVGYFFRDPSAFTAIENAAIELCRGRVLDVGAGTGLHSLVLQEKGMEVTSIDISHHAVEVMRKRGVKDALCYDIFEFSGGPFDTILLMGHGIGIVETIAGLDRFLARANDLLSGEGHVLLDSLDVRLTDDPIHLAYHEANQKAGRYLGEVSLQFEFEGNKGSSCGWVHVDPETLEERAEAAGFRFELLVKEERGDYLARLAK